MSNQHWIILDEELINLDRVTKVEWGPTPTEVNLYDGSAIAFTYTLPSKDEAALFYYKLSTALRSPRDVTDLRDVGDPAVGGPGTTLILSIGSVVTGPAAGGTLVYAYGRGFTSQSVIGFGGALGIGAVPATVIFYEQQFIAAVTPPHVAGAVDFVVTNPAPDGSVFTAFQPGAFTYT